MYYFTYDPWIGKQLYLEDFYVMEPYRGTGVVTFTSSSVDFLLSHIYFVFPGLGIGSEVLRHLSDVSVLTEPRTSISPFRISDQ